MTNSSKIRVRYAETDQMGVVYYANYFIWMEIGRTNLLRDLNITYKEIEENGIILPVAKAFAKYVSPSFYDDEIIIQTTATHFTGSRLRIDYKILRNEKDVVCVGYTEHAFLSKETKKVIKAPEYISSKIIIPDNATELLTKV